MQKYLPKIVGALVNLIGALSPKKSAKIALKLFSTPLRGRLSEKEMDFLGTAYTEELKYEDNLIMTYRWIGTRETIVLAHGWESNSFRWKSLIERLTELDYTIVALDAPGHGRSGGKRFNALLYAECIYAVAKRFKSNIMIGHSVGGMSTVYFLHKYKLPSVEKLILLGAPSNFVGVIKRYSNMMGYSKRVQTALNSLLLERFNYLPEYFNVAKFSSDLSAEGLLIHDKEDAIIPYSDATDFTKYYKHSQLITTNGFGHRLRTDKVNEYIISFINR